VAGHGSRCWVFSNRQQASAAGYGGTLCILWSADH